MELRWRPVPAGLPRTGDAPAGPARRERSGKAGPGLARDLGRGAECFQGRLWFRWFLPDKTPDRPATRVVPLAEAAGPLPAPCISMTSPRSSW